MRKWKRILAVSGLCSCAFAAPALASTNLETGSSLAGISVVCKESGKWFWQQ